MGDEPTWNNISTVYITLTKIARSQAGDFADALIEQALAEIDQRAWTEPTDFDFHTFVLFEKNYLTYTISNEIIEVDGCIFEDMGPIEDLHPDREIYRNSIRIPKRASD